MQDPIAALIGQPLTAVTFVHDYLQLTFDWPTLTVNAPLQISIKLRNYSSTDEMFPHILRNMIESVIQSAKTLPMESINLEFNDDRQISISLDPEQQVGPEAATLTGVGQQIVVW